MQTLLLPHIFFLKNKKFDYNLTSLPGEGALFVPSYDSKIFVLGAVFKPGAYPFTTYYGVRQYLTLAGGANKLAKNRKIRIITSDGKTVKARNNTVISPGDTIVVPEKYLPPEGLLSLILGLTTSVLGVTTTVLTLTR
ncbi:MAG: capsule biosynthesis GfcC family protein [Deltaproteobacteria bacterium]|nr:MAG: capsule biosynthesis GfcC family protein [Deltaproteobacteria bacterium]